MTANASEDLHPFDRGFKIMRNGRPMSQEMLAPFRPANSADARQWLSISL
jgi:hypothetical protein